MGWDRDTGRALHLGESAGPRNQREARMWNRMNEGKVFYPIRLWPTDMQLLWLKDHRNNGDRFQLFLFWVMNGMDPRMAGNHILATDTAAGGLYLAQGYDGAAWRHKDDLVRRARDGVLKGKTFDMIRELYV